MAGTHAFFKQLAQVGRTAFMLLTSLEPASSRRNSTVARTAAATAGVSSNPKMAASASCSSAAGLPRRAVQTPSPTGPLSEVSSPASGSPSEAVAIVHPPASVTAVGASGHCPQPCRLEQPCSSSSASRPRFHIVADLDAIRELLPEPPLPMGCSEGFADASERLEVDPMYKDWYQRGGRLLIAKRLAEQTGPRTVYGFDVAPGAMLLRAAA